MAWTVKNFEPRQTAGERVDDGHAPLLEIEVFLDFICPWCLIGTWHLRTDFWRMLAGMSLKRNRQNW